MLPQKISVQYDLKYERALQIPVYSRPIYHVTQECVAWMELFIFVLINKGFLMHVSEMIE